MNGAENPESQRRRVPVRTSKMEKARESRPRIMVRVRVQGRGVRLLAV